MTRGCNTPGGTDGAEVDSPSASAVEVDVGRVDHACRFARELPATSSTCWCGRSPCRPAACRTRRSPRSCARRPPASCRSRGRTHRAASPECTHRSALRQRSPGRHRVAPVRTSRMVSSNESPYRFCTSGSESRRSSSATYCQASVPSTNSSLLCWTQITGTCSARAVSTSAPMLAMTRSRSWASATTPFCTSMTTSAVFGRSCKLAMSASSGESQSHRASVTGRSARTSPSGSGGTGRCRSARSSPSRPPGRHRTTSPSSSAPNGLTVDRHLRRGDGPTPRSR